MSHLAIPAIRTDTLSPIRNLTVVATIRQQVDLAYRALSTKSASAAKEYDRDDLKAVAHLAVLLE